MRLALQGSGDCERWNENESTLSTAEEAVQHTGLPERECARAASPRWAEKLGEVAHIGGTAVERQRLVEDMKVALTVRHSRAEVARCRNFLREHLQVHWGLVAMDKG